MFLAEILTVVSTALKETFDANYPEADFRDLAVTLEYPATKEFFPGIWVDFEVAGPLQIAGVDHMEFVEAGQEDPDAFRQFRRWRFTGTTTLTVVTLTNFQRARLVDAIIRLVAFGDETVSTSQFRSYIENNPYLATNMDFDQIDIRGMTANPGTPWEGQEVIYEATLAISTIGEFVSDGLTQTLVPLTAVEIHAIEPGQQPGPGVWQ